MAAKRPPTPGTIVITAVDGSSNATAVFKLTASTGTATKMTSGGDLETPIGIAVEANGNVLVADADAFGGKGGVIRVDGGGTQTAVSSAGSFSNPFDVAVEKNGAIVVADPHAAGAGGVLRVDPQTGEQTMLSSGQESGGAAQLREIGIAVESKGTIVILEQNLAGGGMGNGRVTRIDPQTGARTVVASGSLFSSPTGIAVEAKGGILVADANAFGGSGGVIRVNAKTGKQTKVSSGGDFVSPLGVAVEADGNILVADSDAYSGKGGVIRVDPKTGAQKALAKGGSKFTGPRGVAVVPPRG